MLKIQESKAKNNGNGGRMPKASDFKLPKKLDKKTKRLIKAGHAVMDELAKARESRNMQESQTISEHKNGNGTMPKASDFKLPKKLSAAAKRRIETTQVILEGFRKVREEESKSA